MIDLTSYSIGEVKAVDKFPGVYLVTFWSEGHFATWEMDRVVLEDAGVMAETQGWALVSLTELKMTWMQISYITARMLAVKKGWRSGYEATQAQGIAVAWGPNLGCWQVIDGWGRIRPLFDYTEDKDQYTICQRLEEGWDPWDEHPKLSLLFADL